MTITPIDYDGTFKLTNTDQTGFSIKLSDIHSDRAGRIVGKHEVIFGFPFQPARLIHESISREAFGIGVLFIARNLADKHEGFLNFEDLLMLYLSS